MQTLPQSCLAATGAVLKAAMTGGEPASIVVWMGRSASQAAWTESRIFTAFSFK